ncbi:hypothetical protein ScPMuIL_014915 [Solemya velum]
MMTAKTVICPPDSVKGMTVLNRDAFNMKILIPSLILPSENTYNIRKKLKKSQVKLPNVKGVLDFPVDDEKHKTHKLFLLDPCRFSSLKDFDDHDLESLQRYGVDLKSFNFHELEMKYENWSANEILRAVLPDEIDNVSGFSIIGHIAHFNLKADAMKYKSLIGQVVLDKNSTVKTVVNKLNTIDNEFRNFEMELLAGENNFIAQVKENGCTFEFDFSKVYWNSRLATEHQRVVAFLSEGSVLYDIFAGVGPFAIPAAKKNATVLANDLNPNSVESMKKNIPLNKIKSSITCYNLDGRNFIKTILKPDLVSRWEHQKYTDTSSPIYIVMNLPAIAVQFLDVFPALCSDVDNSLRMSKWTSEPIVFCYCFSKSEAVTEDAKHQVTKVLGVPEEALPGLNVRHVRNVAPNKEMLCVNFTLSKDILFGKVTRKSEHEENDEPESKRLKTS